MIRVRGKSMPEQATVLEIMNIEGQKSSKPILAEHKIKEIDEAIYIAMEFASLVTITFWKDRFFRECCGLIHRFEEINKILYIEEKDGAFVRIAFDDIADIGVE